MTRKQLATRMGVRTSSITDYIRYGPSPKSRITPVLIDTVWWEFYNHKTESPYLPEAIRWSLAQIGQSMHPRFLKLDEHGRMKPGKTRSLIAAYLNELLLQNQTTSQKALIEYFSSTEFIKKRGMKIPTPSLTGSLRRVLKDYPELNSVIIKLTPGRKLGSRIIYGKAVPEPQEPQAPTIVAKPPKIKPMPRGRNREGHVVAGYMIYLDDEPFSDKQYETWHEAFEVAKQAGMVTEDEGEPTFNAVSLADLPENHIRHDPHTWHDGAKIYAGIWENGRFRRKIQGRYED